MEPNLEARGNEELVRRSQMPYLVVLASGILTSVLALAGVYWLNKNATDFHIMGWYANFVIPAGAIIVGAVAGCGYGLASWFTGVRIGRGLLWTVVLLQTLAYVAAEYVEYRDIRDEFKRAGAFGAPVQNFPSFLEFYDLKARSFAWKKDNGGAGNALGGWGYVFVLLGAAGFILGGLIAPAILFASPYCDTCQRYMKRKVIGALPASVPVKKIGKKDTGAQEEHAKEQQEAAARADEAVERIRAAVAANDLTAFTLELNSAGSAKQINKLPSRVEVALISCRSCEGGRIVLTLASGFGEQSSQVPLGELPVSPEFVQAHGAG